MTDASRRSDEVSPWLLLVTIDDVDAAVPLPMGDVTVGSSASSDVVLAHATVSRRHARLRVEEDRVRIEDLGSLNGTRLEGRVLTEMETLPAGARVALGVAEVRLARSSADDEESSASATDRPDAVTRTLIPTDGDDRLRRFLLDLVPRLVETEEPVRAASHVARSSADALLTVSGCRGVSVAIGEDEVVSARGDADGFVATATATAGRVTVRMDFASEGDARRARGLAVTVAEMVRRAGRTPTRDHGGSSRDPSADGSDDA